MANEVMTVTDPAGNSIHVLEGICLSPAGKNSPDIYDDVLTVIKKPALLIQSNEAEELYYFRSIGWHRTILLIVRFENNRWETAECVHDPSTEYLSELLKTGRQLL